MMMANPHNAQEFQAHFESLGNINGLQSQSVALAYHNAITHLVVDERDLSVLAINAKFVRCFLLDNCSFCDAMHLVKKQKTKNALNFV